MTCRAGCAVSLAIAVGVSVVGAAEQPIGADKLLLRRTSSGNERLTFVSKDPAFLFPALGGPDDPSPSGSGGLLVEIFTLSAPAGAPLDAPGGLGSPGWSVRTSTPPRLQLKNAGAPASPSTLRSITLKEGKVLKLSGKEIGLLSTPLGSVGIRITTGSLVNCARFGPTTVRKDTNDTFSARNALASAIIDCSDNSLFARRRRRPPPSPPRAR